MTFEIGDSNIYSKQKTKHLNNEIMRKYFDTKSIHEERILVLIYGILKNLKKPLFFCSKNLFLYFLFWNTHKQCVQTYHYD